MSLSGQVTGGEQTDGRSGGCCPPGQVVLDRDRRRHTTVKTMKRCNGSQRPAEVESWQLLAFKCVEHRTQRHLSFILSSFGFKAQIKSSQLEVFTSSKLTSASKHQQVGSRSTIRTVEDVFSALIGLHVIVHGPTRCHTCVFQSCTEKVLVHTPTAGRRPRPHRGTSTKLPSGKRPRP